MSKNELFEMQDYQSRAVTPENFTGEKGKGGMAEVGSASYASRELGQGWKVSPYIVIKPGETVDLANIEGPGIVNHIWITDTCKENRRLILRVYYDDSDVAAIETPLCDFFASANYQKFAQISSLKVCVNPNHGFNCYWDMPFRQKIRFELESQAAQDVLVFYQIDYTLRPLSDDVLYLHASFRRENPLAYKEPYTILDTIEGEGKYVGTYLFWGVNSGGWWGEGEVKFYIDDDKEFPTICGTGTEDYFGGAHNFDVDGNYLDYTNPYTGLSVIKSDNLYKPNLRFSMYRWHVTDPVYFHKNLKVTVQALGWRSEGRYYPRMDDISSVAFWYQKGTCKNMPSFPSRDELEII